MRGVTKNPLADEPEAPRVRPDAAGYVDEFALQLTVSTTRVTFQGKDRAIHVAVKAVDVAIGGDVLARAILGDLLRELLRHHLLREALITSPLSLTPPLCAKVTLRLGELTLYATARTSDAELAQRLAVDAVAHLLTHAKVVVAEGARLCKLYGVEVTNRT